MTPTDHPEPPEVDEAEAAVHAVLDGEATPAQRRLVARDPRLLARVEDLRRVAAAVGEAPPPPPPEVLDRIRAAALDAAAPDTAPPGPGAPADERTSPPADDRSAHSGAPTPERPAGDGTVTPLAPRRARPPRRWPALPAVAAAILLLVAIGVGLIVTDDDGDDSASDAGDAATEEVAAPRFDVQASYPSEESLREALQEVDPTTLAGVTDPPAAAGREDGDATSGDEAPGAVTDPAAQRCDAVLRSTDERIGPAQASAVVDVDGTPMLVLSNPVDDDEGGHVQLTVLDATSCVPQLAVRR